MLSLAIWSGSAQGDEGWVPDMRATPMLEGELAPHDGQLLTTELAIQIAAKAEQCDTKARIDVEAERALCVARIDGVEDVHRIVSEGHRKEIQRLGSALEREAAARSEAESERWRWAQVAGGVGVLIGVAGTVVIGTAAVWAAGELAGVVAVRGGQ